MKPDLDSVVAELCALDSDLAKDPVLVRQIVEELQRSTPRVAIDDAFRARLRAELLRTPSAVAHKQQLPWWLLYTAPVGVTILLLMLVRPDFAPAPQVVPEAAPEAAPGTMMKMDTMMSDEAFGTGPAEESLETGMADGATDYFTAALAADSTTVTITYLSLQTPGFIVVTDAVGTLVAVSGYITAGEHTNVTFEAPAPFASGTLYTATLFYDDGDGVYTEGIDTPAFDMLGAPIALPLMAL
jgi:hypothetical protein